MGPPFDPRCDPVDVEAAVDRPQVIVVEDKGQVDASHPLLALLRDQLRPAGAEHDHRHLGHPLVQIHDGTDQDVSAFSVV